jgi:hypothetical protein
MIEKQRELLLKYFDREKQRIVGAKYKQSQELQDMISSISLKVSSSNRDRIIEKYITSIRENYKKKVQKWIRNTPWDRTQLLDGQVVFNPPPANIKFFQPPPQVRSFAQVGYKTSLSAE